MQITPDEEGITLGKFITQSVEGYTHDKECYDMIVHLEELEAEIAGLKHSIRELMIVPDFPYDSLGGNDD